MITVIGNLKGGCGKSTVTFNLAVWLSLAGRDVITFDLDPQSTLSDVAEVRSEEEVQPPVRVFRPESDPARIMREHQGEVLVDVGASNMWSMRQAITLAHRILIPVLPSQADVWSTQRFLTLVEETLAGRPAPQIVLFINRADTHPGMRETEETHEVLQALPATTTNQLLHQRTVYRRSFSEGRAVFELEPDGKAAEEFYEFAKALFPDSPGPAFKFGGHRPPPEPATATASASAKKKAKAAKAKKKKK